MVCDARRLFSGPSAFEQALELWSREPLGSARALSALDRACDAAAYDERGTEDAACTTLGLMYASGEGVTKDARRAFDYFERSAHCSFSFGGDDFAQIQEAHTIASEGVGCCGGRSCPDGCESACEDAIVAIRAAVIPPLERACAAGRGVGCYMSARLAGEGEYVQRIGRVNASPPRSAQALDEAACKAGVGPACEIVAYGLEVPFDAGGGETPASHRMMQRACDVGWGDACYRLGKTSEKTSGRRAALGQYEKACHFGLTRVCGELTEIFSTGAGGAPIDPKRAMAMYLELMRP